MIFAGAAKLLTQSGTTFAEPLKTELNREVGKRVEKITGKKANLKKPQIVALLDLENDSVDVEINSLYIYGRYRKLIRGIPQTRWPCRECGGKVARGAIIPEKCTRSRWMNLSNRILWLPPGARILLFTAPGARI